METTTTTTTRKRTRNTGGTSTRKKARTGTGATPAVSRLTPEAGAAFGAGVSIIDRPPRPLVPTDDMASSSVLAATERPRELVQILPRAAQTARTLLSASESALPSVQQLPEAVAPTASALADDTEVTHTFGMQQLVDHTSTWGSFPVLDTFFIVGGGELLDDALLSEMTRRQRLRNQQLELKRQQALQGTSTGAGEDVDMPDAPPLLATGTVEEKGDNDDNDEEEEEEEDNTSKAASAPPNVGLSHFMPGTGTLSSNVSSSSSARSGGSGGGTRRDHNASTVAHVENYNQIREREQDAFLTHDPLDPRTGYEKAPSAYMFMTLLWDTYKAAYDQRENTSRCEDDRVPRPRGIEVVSKQYMLAFRLPPGVNDRRCRNGDACLFNFKAYHDNQPSLGYCGREFVSPSVLRAWRDAGRQPTVEEQPLGLCVDCMIFRTTEAFHVVRESKTTPAFPLHTFKVMCARGEYPLTGMLPIEVDGEPTGIVGHVPAYALDKRQYVPLYAPDAAHVVYDPKRDSLFDMTDADLVALFTLADASAEQIIQEAVAARARRRRRRVVPDTGEPRDDAGDTSNGIDDLVVDTVAAAVTSHVDPVPNDDDAEEDLVDNDPDSEDEEEDEDDDDEEEEEEEDEEEEETETTVDHANSWQSWGKAASRAAAVKEASDADAPPSEAAAAAPKRPKPILLFHYLAEIHSDFRPRLSEADVCLGVRKMRALLGSGGRRVMANMHPDAVPLPGRAWLLPMGDTESQWSSGVAWRQFQRRCTAAVLSDRHLGIELGLVQANTRHATARRDCNDNDDDGTAPAVAAAARLAARETRMMRVPAASLRRYFLQRPHRYTYHDPEATPAAPPRLTPHGRGHVREFAHVRPSIVAAVDAFVGNPRAPTAAARVARTCELVACWLDTLLVPFECTLNALRKVCERVVSGRAHRNDMATLVLLMAVTAPWTGARAALGASELDELLDKLTVPSSLSGARDVCEPGLVAARLARAILGCNLIWSTAVWRCCCAQTLGAWLAPHMATTVAPSVAMAHIPSTLIPTLLRPALRQGAPAEWRAGDRRWLLYQLRYVSDTHIDLLYVFQRALAVTASSAIVGDMWLLETNDAATRLLENAYPTLTRVMCAEELPDMTSLLLASNPWFETNSKKGESTLFRAFIHALISKLEAHPCMRRGIDNILGKGIARYEVLAHLLVLQLRASMLGNYPGSTCVPVNLHTRCVLNAMFDFGRSATQFDALLASALYRPAPPAPSSVVAAVSRFVKTYTMTTMYAMREFLFFMADMNGTHDGYLSTNGLWIQFKALSRHASASIRRCLADMVRRGSGPTIPLGNLACGLSPCDHLDWTLIEHVVHVNRKTKLEEGIAYAYQTRVKALYVKIRKGRFEEVLLKKMGAIQTKLGKVLGERAGWPAHLRYLEHPDVLRELADWLRADDRYEYLRLAAWVSARASQGLVHDNEDGDGDARAAHWRRMIMPTRWLQGLGMTERGVATVRRWTFEYNTCIISDDGFKKEIIAFGEHSVRDFVLLKFFMRHYVAERRATPFFLTTDDVAMQSVALRRQLKLEPWQATPPHAALYYACFGCDTWANHCLSGTLATPDSRTRARPAKKKSTAAPSGTPARSRTASKKKKAAHVDREGVGLRQPITTRAHDARPITLVNCYYHPFNGRLYCRRRRVLKTKRPLVDAAVVAAGLAGDDGDVEQGAAIARAAVHVVRRPRLQLKKKKKKKKTTATKRNKGAKNKKAPQQSSSSSSSSHRAPSKQQQQRAVRDAMTRLNSVLHSSHQPADTIAVSGEDDDEDDDNDNEEDEGDDNNDADSNSGEEATRKKKRPTKGKRKPKEDTTLQVDTALLFFLYPPDAPWTEETRCGRDFPLRPPCTSADSSQCAHPLWPMGMLGVWRRFHKELYGLCQVCGILTVVKDHLMTDRGLVCALHLLPSRRDMPLTVSTALHPQQTMNAVESLLAAYQTPLVPPRAAKASGRSRRAAPAASSATPTAAASTTSRTPASMDPFTPQRRGRYWTGRRIANGSCFGCGMPGSAIKIPVIDHAYRLWSVSLCDECVQSVRHYLPVPGDPSSLSAFLMRSHAYQTGDGAVPHLAAYAHQVAVARRSRRMRLVNGAIPPVNIDDLLAELPHTQRVLLSRAASRARHIKFARYRRTTALAQQHSAALAMTMLDEGEDEDEDDGPMVFDSMNDADTVHVR